MTVVRRFFLILVFLHAAKFVFAQSNSDPGSISIYLTGLPQAEVAVFPATGGGSGRPLAGPFRLVQGVAQGMQISGQMLPGEVLLRFSFYDPFSGQQSQSEKKIILGNQPLTVYINPAFVQHPDSVRFQDGERENTLYASFVIENQSRRSQVSLLQWFLIQYGDTGSEFYTLAYREFESQRKAYNEWLKAWQHQHKDMFFARSIQFQHIPPVGARGSQKERLLYMLDHFFEGIDLSDALIIRTRAFSEWLSQYMTIYGELAESYEELNDLQTRAGRQLIEASLQGDPAVCGHLVDYFYRGFESYGIQDGLQMLGRYLDHPRCHSSRRSEISRRLEVMERMQAGNPAPDFVIGDAHDSFRLYEHASGRPYLLLVFWSLECGHCKTMFDELTQWKARSSHANKTEIITINLDADPAFIAEWKEYTGKLSGWKHLRAEQGFNSQLARDYGILATPYMYLLDGNSKMIQYVPSNSRELDAFLSGSN